MEKSDCKDQPTITKAGLRFASTMHGELFVMTNGILKTQWLLADNVDFWLKVSAILWKLFVFKHYDCCNSGYFWC